MLKKLFDIPKDPRNTREIPAKVALKSKKKEEETNYQTSGQLIERPPV